MSQTQADPWAGFTEVAPPKNDPWAEFAEVAPPKDGVISQSLSGGYEGVANVLGAPVDLVSSAIEMLPGDQNLRERAFGGSQFFRNLFEEASLIGNEPQGLAEGLSRSIGRNFMEGMGFLMGGTAVANVARKGTGPGARLADDVVRGVTTRPAVAAASEATEAIGAGVGGEAAARRFPDNPNARFYGELAGGLSAPTVYGGGKAIVTRSPAAQVARAGAEMAVPELRTRRATEVARRSISDQVTGEALDELERVEGVAGRIQRGGGGELDLSLAERTNAPSLRGIQSEIEGAASGQALDDLMRRRASNAAAIDRFSEAAAPKARADVDLEQSLLSGRRARQAAVNEADRRIANKEARLVRETLPDGYKTDTGGEALRDTIRAEYGKRQQRMSALADEMGLNEAVDIPFNDQVQTLLKQYDDAPRFSRPGEEPAVIREMRQIAEADAIAQQSGEALTRMTFEDYQSLIRRLDIDARDAMGGAQPNRVLARKLRGMRDEAEALAEEAFEEAGRPDLRQNYREFRDIYRRDIVEPFQKGAVHKVIGKNGRGEYLTSDEAVALQFFGKKTSSQTAAKQLRSAVGDAAAEQHIRTAALYDLRQAAVKNGRVDANAVRSWKTRHRQVLDQFPALKADVENLEKAKRAILDQQAALRAREAGLGEGVLNVKLRAMESGGRTVDNLIADSLNNPRLMQEVLKELRADPGAKVALKRKLWENISTQNPESIRAALSRHSETLKLALGQNHFDDLRAIADAREITSRVPAPAGRGEVPDMQAAFQETTGFSPAQAANRVLQVQGGFIGARFGVFDLLSRAGYALNRKQVLELQAQALYDPDVARDLHRAMQTGRVAKPVELRLRGYLLDAGQDPSAEDERE